MSKNIETYIVDSFTDEVFKGNPAAICILMDELPDETMQSIAKELGLSETAFICEINKPNKYSIRYFSPKVEIPLCGHATLAASKVMFEKEGNLSSLHFVNIQDLDLLIEKKGDEIEMKFPIYSTEDQKPPRELLNALGLNEVLNCVYNSETNILLLEIDNSKELAKLKPDFIKLIKAHDSINGVLVTAPSSKTNYDFESRYFWPWSGTNEDPVTGGTHTFLAKYWGTRLGKTKMNSFQCSERTGFMEVELISETEFTIKSKAQIVFEGKLII